MNLLDRIKRDVQRITSDINGFAVSLHFTSKSVYIEAVDDYQVIETTVPGTSTKHHLSFDSDGFAANVKKASCTVSEYNLLAVGYPFKNQKGDVDLIDHKVQWTDSHGATPVYKILQQYPDEKLGLIVLILGDYDTIYD